MPTLHETAEYRRLQDSRGRQADWKSWGPYLAERAWGTVREDYSASGEAWDFFPHDHARSRVYRWNEDGLGGFSNRYQNICLALALWNERDPILKERLFGLSGPEGNHGEDVKEYYFYLEGTPTHSYCKMLYRYPQVEYPYAELIRVNRERDKTQGEYELIDALYQSFEAGRYWDVMIEYAKADQDDLLCRISAVNQGPDSAPIHLLPQVWLRNTWSWGYNRERPLMRSEEGAVRLVDHRHLGDRWWWAQAATGAAGSLMFTENTTNAERLWGLLNESPYVKDSFHDAIIGGRTEAINPAGQGTKAASHFQAEVPPGASFIVEVRFSDQHHAQPFQGFSGVFDERIAEAEEFYAAVAGPEASEEDRAIQGQAFAGLMWSKQFYHYGVELWRDGDPGQPIPPASRKRGRNSDWTHLYTLDVLSMPDKWEYPWFAAWDLAFHMIPVAMIDPEWAKRQLLLMLREWYMHPNGQIPAYEWAFGDVNPPVHAWACWRVYKIARNVTGVADVPFLERVFHKLLLNFTWWVNRKDADGNNVFQGGFLGLDNIGVFDRSAGLPVDGQIDQADGTAWMAMYCLNMLAIALELARHNPAYEDVATKFFEHFIYISQAMTAVGRSGLSLWDEEDGFFYDILREKSGRARPLRTRSLVGLIPLFAVETIEPDLLEKLPRFKRRMEWFLKYRPHLVEHIASLTEPGEGGRLLLTPVDRDKLLRVLRRMLDKREFLSPYGLRSLSKFHETNPYVLELNGDIHVVRYTPAESDTGLFGGNSNWRGPIWFPINFLMVESLQKYDHYYGDSLTVELPTESGNWLPLNAVADDLSNRLVDLFRVDASGRRPAWGGVDLFQRDPRWRDHIPFYEYFHGDNGAGIGASHQTGWTALAAKLIQRSGGK